MADFVAHASECTISCAGYLVLYSTSLSDPAVTWLVRAVTGDKDDVTIRGLASNTTHYFKIQARNSAGYGPLSLPVNYTTLAGRCHCDYPAFIANGV